MQRVTASVKPVPPSPAATRASAARKRGEARVWFWLDLPFFPHPVPLPGREEVAPTSPQPAPVSSLVVSANAPLPAAVVWVGERIGTCHYPAAQFGGRVYHVSDTVLLQSGLAQPFVCRIERMMQKGPRKVMFVRWMFRPADVPDAAEMLQREPYAQEVFLTDVVEENDLATILARCYVLPPHRYAHLPSTLYDANVFCCSLLFRTQRECFEPLDVMRVGPLYAEPPARAPRINMPAVPLSGVPFPGFARGPKKKKRANGAVLSCDAPSVSAACVCCIDKCDNICWSRLHPSTVLMHDWVYKPRGRFVCEQHLLRDMRLRSHKRSRSLTDPRLCAPASLTMAPANGEHQEADKRAKR